MVARMAEKRRDWSVANATLLRLTVTAADATLHFAGPGQRQWQSCAGAALDRAGRALPARWLPRAHIGVWRWAAHGHAPGA